MPVLGGSTFLFIQVIAEGCACIHSDIELWTFIGCRLKVVYLGCLGIIAERREDHSGNKLRSLFLAALIRSGFYAKLASYFMAPQYLLSFIDAT